MLHQQPREFELSDGSNIVGACATYDKSICRTDPTAERGQGEPTHSPTEKINESLPKVSWLGA